MIEPARKARYERELRAMIAEAGRDDPATFAVVVQLLDDARSQLPNAARQLRTPVGDAPGYSWNEIADALGISRQGARQRFGRESPRRVEIRAGRHSIGQRGQKVLEARERHPYERGEDTHPMETDPLCAVCGQPKKFHTHN